MTPFERLQALSRPGRIPTPPRQLTGALAPAPGAQTAFDRLQAQAMPGRLPMQGQPQMAAPPAMPPQQPQGQPQAAQEPLSGFRSPMVQQGLLGLGMGLLEASGPSAQPVSLGQAMSRGMNAGVGMMQQERGNQMQERMMGLREQQIEADNAEAAAKAEALQAQRAAMEELMRSPAIPDAVKAMGPEAVMQYAKTHAGELAKPERPNLQLQTILDGGQQRQVLMDMNTGQPVRDMGAGPRWDPNRGPLSSTTINMPEAGPQIGTIPPGFQVTRGPDGGYRMEPIPGGPVDREIQEDAARAEAADRQKNVARGTVVQDAGRALEMISKQPDLTTGPVAAATRHIPGTPAYVLQGMIDSMASNIGIDVLGQMRENSKSGAALGAVPFQQQQRLEQVYGNMALGQPADVLIDNLKRLDNIYSDMIHGTPEQIQELVSKGQISQQEAAPLMERHQLSFDERGRPAGGQAPSGPPDPATAPVEDILEYWSTR